MSKALIMREVWISSSLTENYGIISNIPKVNYVIYCQDPKELLGFRQTHTRSKIGDTHYFEIGFFMDMLFEGYPEAYMILGTPEVGIELNDLRGLDKDPQIWENRGLISNLLTDSHKFLKKIDKKLANYGNWCYICAMNMNFASNLMKNEGWKLTNQVQLQNFLDEKVEPKQVKMEIRRKLKECDNQFAQCDFPYSLDKDLINNWLLEIRQI